jgi:hypothetical protein
MTAGGRSAATCVSRPLLPPPTEIWAFLLSVCTIISLLRPGSGTPPVMAGAVPRSGVHQSDHECHPAAKWGRYLLYSFLIIFST